MDESMFAKSMLGYNRRQVDSFLLDMTQSFSRKEAMMKDRVRQLEASLTEQKKETEGHDDEITRREEVIAQRDSELARREDELAARERDLTQCKAELAECELELARYKELLAQRDQEIARLQSSHEAENRQEQSDLQLHATIGQRIASADKHAEEIISNAQKHAEEITANAQKHSETILADARRRAEMDLNQIITEVRGRCAVIGQAADLFSEHMGDITEELRKTEALLYAATEDSKRKLTEQLQ